MNVLQLAKVKARFSSVIKEAQEGKETIVTKGHDSTPVAVIVPYAEWKRTQPRTLGTLEHSGPVVFADDWYMTDEELLGS
jgi:prevent-host-death family protein